jgi:nitrite reductase/ring-hydroxylating ferredoxin subunit/uncharacterized membrane protein
VIDEVRGSARNCFVRGYDRLVLNPELPLNRRIADRVARLPWLGSIADAIQPKIAKAIAAGGPAVKNALAGTWLGHPLHPVLTDIPTGAWTVTAALDVCELFGADRFAAGADASLLIGMAGAYGAVATGYADWSDTSGAPKTVGLAHATLNGAATTLYLGSFVARRRRSRGIGIALAMAGYGLMSAAAYLGGELSLGMNLGAKHTAVPIFPPDDFTPVLDDADLAKDKPTRVEFAGIPLLLLRTGDEIRAIGAACTHRGAPLDEGTFEDGCIRCPWHGSLFSFEDGRVLEGPASFPQPIFETRLRGGKIEVRPLAG